MNLRMRAALALAALAVLATHGLAQAPAPAASADAAPKIDFEKYTLPNGLQVILHVDRKLPDRPREPVVPRRLEERAGRAARASRTSSST